jgi:hypothetical protein
MNDIRKCLERIDCVLASNEVGVLSDKEDDRIDVEWIEGLIDGIKDDRHVFVCYPEGDFKVKCIKSWVVREERHRFTITFFLREKCVNYSDNMRPHISRFSYTSKRDLVDRLICCNFLPETSRDYGGR